MIAAMHDLHFVQYLFRSFFSFTGFYTGIDQWQLYIFKNGELVYQIKTLEDETNISFSQISSFAFIEFGYFNSIEHKATAVGVVQQPYNIEQSGFTTS